MTEVCSRRPFGHLDIIGPDSHLCLILVGSTGVCPEGNDSRSIILQGYFRRIRQRVNQVLIALIRDARPWRFHALPCSHKRSRRASCYREWHIMHAMERHCGPPALQQQTELRRELRVPSTLLSNCLDSQNGTKVRSPIKDSCRLP